MSKIERDKIIETILYIANKIPECTPMRCMKLMYIADKTSLEHIGRFISSDLYLASPNGAVPMYAAEIFLKVFKIDETHMTHPLKNTRQADTDKLSQSDVTTLDLIIKLYGEYPMWHLRQMIQDKAWGAAVRHEQRIVSEDSIAGTFDNGGLLIEYLHTH